MKPLIIITLPDSTDSKVHKDFSNEFMNMQKAGYLNEYEVLILQGCSAKVYYPVRNWFKFIYYKIKAWVTLKTTKNK